MDHDAVMTAAAKLADAITYKGHPLAVLAVALLMLACAGVGLLVLVLWATTRPRRAYRMLMRRVAVSGGQ